MQKMCLFTIVDLNKFSCIVLCTYAGMSYLFCVFKGSYTYYMCIERERDYVAIRTILCYEEICIHYARYCFIIPLVFECIFRIPLLVMSKEDLPENLISRWAIESLGVTRTWVWNPLISRCVRKYIGELVPAQILHDPLLFAVICCSLCGLIVSFIFIFAADRRSRKANRQTLWFTVEA